MLVGRSRHHAPNAGVPKPRIRRRKAVGRAEPLGRARRSSRGLGGRPGSRHYGTQNPRDICLDTDNAEIEDIVGRLGYALSFSIDTPTTPLRISASIGYVRDGASYRDAERFLRDADSAMYRSKLSGRDCATAYVTAMTSGRGLRP
jgi:hypothetical protein